MRQPLFNEADAFDRFIRRADVLLITGADREDERIENDVARRHPVAVNE